MNRSTVNIPEPPQQLSTLAQQEFRRLAATLAQRGNLDPVRMAALEIYAISFAHCREAEKRLLASTTVAQREAARSDLNNASRQMRIAGRTLALGTQSQAGPSPRPQADKSHDEAVLAEQKGNLNRALPE
jgi:phage terminase small subunit